MIPNSQLLNLWWAALAEPIGLGLKVLDPSKAKSLLYAARSKARNPSLDVLSIRTSPTSPADEIWIVHEEPQPDYRRGGQGGTTLGAAAHAREA